MKFVILDIKIYNHYCFNDRTIGSMQFAGASTRAGPSAMRGRSISGTPS